VPKTKSKPGRKTKGTAQRKLEVPRMAKATTRHCLALDLKNDPALISEYKRYHEKVWPEITASLREAGIQEMEIYLVGNRLFMIIEVSDGFSFERKAQLDRDNPKVQEWENLMWKFQQPLPNTKHGEKWQRGERVFDLEK
jgi:L-rhamnose mutarotase